MLSPLLLIALVRGVAGVRVEEVQEDASEGPAKALALAGLLAPGAEALVLDNRQALGRVQPGSVAAPAPVYPPVRTERLRGLLRLQGGEGAEDAEANVPAGMKVVCDGNECQLVGEDEADALDAALGEAAGVVVPTRVSPEDLEAGKQGVEEEVASATFGEKVHECWGNTKSWLCWLRGAVFPGNPARKRGPPPVHDFRAGTQSQSRAMPKGKSAVKNVRSAKEFQQLITGAPARQLVVVDFFATWCGPCKEIAPKYEQMARDMRHVLFLKVDVDANKDLAQQYGVKSMPTFKLLRKARVVDDLTGADAEALRAKVEALAGKASRLAYAGAGRQL